jgi:sugar phosphate isomerase/epimerase
MPQNLSFQLYSARDHQPWDKVIAMLAKAGYTDVEGFGGVYDEPEKFRALLDQHNLSMSSKLPRHLACAISIAPM